MNKMHVASIIFLITLSLMVIPQATTSSDPSVHFDSSPTTTWYTNAPYQYVATISSPYNWTLKTDATLHMSDGNIANDTASQTIFGILATGSYWVNISISYHNSTGKTTLLTYQNYTLNIVNKPFIYSTPETFFYPDSTYNYTYEINQGNITGHSSGMKLNKTSQTLSEYLTGTSYAFFITVSDKNGTYTQDWGVSSNDLSTMTFDALIGSGIVNVTAPITGIGVNDTTIFLNGTPVFTSIGLTHPYSLNIVNNLYYTISTDSQASQDATIFFNKLASGASYRIYLIYDNGTFNDYVSSATVPASGTLSFTYVPATMQLDPIVELISYTAPPPQQPAKQIIPPTQNYVNYLESISGILLLIGLLAIFMMGILYLKRSEVK